METGRQLGRKRGEYGIPETKRKTSFQKEGVINCASEAESIYIHYQAGNSVILMISWSLMCSWALSFPINWNLLKPWIISVFFCLYMEPLEAVF